MDNEAHPAGRDRSPDPGTGRRRRSRLVRPGAGAVALLAVFLLVTTCVVQPFRIPSGSMENTLERGDRVLVNKLAYRFGNLPRRGDVVVFDGTGSFLREPSGGTDYVKRVVGVGGDRITCCDDRGRIEVNGEAVDEDYVYPGDRASAVPFDIEVPPERLWVMGDHRSRSRDSRAHLGAPGGGTVPVDRVVGRVDWIVWPVERWNRLRDGRG